MELLTCKNLCDAIVHLFSPLAEIVIHDLETGKICHIAGDLSKREVEDPSLLDVDNLEDDLHQVSYPKINFDGRLVKSVSVPLHEKWLVCINCDVSLFHQMQAISQALLTPDTSRGPHSLFKNDWQERVHIAVHKFLEDSHWRFEALTGKQKKEVLKNLFAQGAFGEKGAADYIAQMFNIGRATIFNYLREWKTHDIETVQT